MVDEFSALLPHGLFIDTGIPCDLSGDSCIKKEPVVYFGEAVVSSLSKRQ